MRIKFYFSILVLFLLGLGGVLLYLAKGMKPLHLYIVEGIIAFILVFLFIFYRKIVKPMNIIGSGMELLREQDFSSRLSKVGQYEADRIVNVFNRMMEQLKNERLRLREQNHFLDLLIQASPMGVVITTLNGEISQLNPMGLKMMGVRLEEIMGKKIENIDSPLAEELANISKDQTAVVRLNDSNIYKCTHSSFIDRGFHHPFYLIEKMTDEVMRAEKKAYEKVIRMIAHEVNNTTAGITSTLDTVEQALSTEEDMEDICDVMRVCTERCFSMSRFITRFADVVKIPEPALVTGKLNELAAYGLLIGGVALYIFYNTKRGMIYVTVFSLFIAVVWIISINYNSGENYLNKRIFERLIFEDGEMMGANRTTDFFQTRFDRYVVSSDIWFGVGRDAFDAKGTSTTNILNGCAGWKRFYFLRGVVGCFLLLLFLFSYWRKYPSSKAGAFLILFLVANMIRDYPLREYFLFIYLLAIPVLYQRKVEFK